MDVLVLLMFIGALWVLSAIGFFAWNLMVSNHEHADRLALLPLEGNWTDGERAQPNDEEGEKP